MYMVLLYHGSLYGLYWCLVVPMIAAILLYHCLVPFCMASKDQAFTVPADHNATLSDVAPTILRLMGIDKPVEMTGISLI